MIREAGSIIHCAEVGSKAGALAAAQGSYMTAYNFDDLSLTVGESPYRPRGTLMLPGRPP